jgi:hypothetical protein
MVPWTGAMPRRARYLIPRGLPRRGEAVAACAVAIVAAHLLLAQLTLVLAVVFVVVSKVSRWRLGWLLGPASAGLAWALAIGPDKALAGFAAGPAGILWHLGGGHLAGAIGHPLAGFDGIQDWLPRQFPVALACGAAEAALAGWLDWLHTDEWAVPPARPGLVAAVRRALAASTIRAGTVVTRDGCALGVVPATGAVAELRWAELARGTLVVGSARQEVTLAGLQVVHAALRLRKPVIVLGPGDTAITSALGRACRATGTPLLGTAPDGGGHPAQVAEPAGAVTAPGASRLWGRAGAQETRSGPPAAIDLGRVVRQRAAAILPVDSPELAGWACAELGSLAADLRRIGVDGDALVWVPDGELVPRPALAALLRDGPEAGLALLIGTSSSAAATEFAGLVGAALIYRVTDRDLAASLAARTGTRLIPAALAAALDAGRPGPGPTPTSAFPSAGGTAPAFPSPSAGGPAPVFPSTGGPVPAFPSPSTGGPAPVFPSTGGPPPASGLLPPDLVPSPVIPARDLLTLAQGEFVLTAGWPRPRLVAPGRLVPARLPHRPGRVG